MKRTREKAAERDAWRKWWLTPEELDHYGIRHDPERWAHYLGFAAWSRVVRRPLSDPKTAAIADNKWLFHHYYGSQGFPLPAALGLVHPIYGAMLDGTPCRNLVDLVRWLHLSRTSSFVVKPLAGWNSEGLVVCSNVNWDDAGWMFETPEGWLSHQEFQRRVALNFRGTAGCVVQERCHPAAGLRELGLCQPSAVRIVVFMPESGTPEVHAAVLFVGRERAMVNSWTKGAISIPIEPRSGRLGSGRTLPSFGTSALTHHPDSDERFEGRILPGWSDARSVALRASCATPNLRLVCWELLLTDGGAKLLEANLGFGLTMLQVHTEGFLKDGTAKRWAEAGAELPDGTTSWGRPGWGSRVYRKVGRLAQRGMRRL